MELTTLTTRVAPDEAAYLDQIASRHEGILSKQGVMRLLLQQARDSGWDPLDSSFDPAMLLGKGGRGVGANSPEVLREERSISSSSYEEEKIDLKRRVPKQVSDAPRKRFVFSVPDDLSDYKADLLSYWREDKGGKKSEAAAKTLIAGCRAIRDRYGDKVLRSQIEMARGYGWDNITLSNYEKFGLPKGRGGAHAQPEIRHPAHRVFTAERGFDDGLTTNPALEGLF